MACRRRKNVILTPDKKFSNAAFSCACSDRPTTQLLSDKVKQNGPQKRNSCLQHCSRILPTEHNIRHASGPRSTNQKCPQQEQHLEVLQLQQISLSPPLSLSLRLSTTHAHKAPGTTFINQTRTREQPPACMPLSAGSGETAAGRASSGSNSPETSIAAPTTFPPAGCGDEASHMVALSGYASSCASSFSSSPWPFTAPARSIIHTTSSVSVFSCSCS